MTTTKSTTLEPDAQARNAVDEIDIEARIDEALTLLEDGAPFEVKVGGRWTSVKPHPLAMAFPVLPRQEFAELVADVAAHGFREPVHMVLPGRRNKGQSIFGAPELEVLEGRHRVAVAYVLGLSITASPFTGTDEQAADLVDSYNLHRRHLSTAFRTLRVAQRILPSERAKAEERKRAGNAKGGQGTGPASTKLSATQAAAIRSGGAVSARNLDLMAPVLEAPDTQRRIAAGEVTTVAAARREALAEIAAMPKTKRPKAYRATSPVRTAGPTVAASVKALTTHAESLRKAIANDHWGSISPEAMVEALTEVRGILAEAEEHEEHPA